MRIERIKYRGLNFTVEIEETRSRMKNDSWVATCDEYPGIITGSDEHKFSEETFYYLIDDVLKCVGYKDDNPAALLTPSQKED